MVLRGCMFGCLGLLVLALMLAGFVVYLAYEFDILQAALPVDTVAHIGGEPVVLARVDPNRAGLLRLLTAAFEQDQTGRKIIEAFVPHEITLALNLEDEGTSVRQTLAMSLRRLAGLLAWFDDGEAWRMSPVQEDIRITNPEDGLLLVTARWPTIDASRAPAPDDVSLTPLTLPRESFLAAYVDNRAGGAYLALEPLLEHAGADEAPSETGPTQEGAEFSVQHLMRVFARLELAELSADMRLPETGEGPLADWEAWRLIQLVIDFRAVAEDPGAAEEMMVFLTSMRDWARRDLVDEDIEIHGEFVREDNTVTGAFTVDGLAEPIVKALREEADADTGG